ncbi:ATPase involved in chromosome partitioning [Mycobacteroides abscessus subsp. bolletii]|nr:ATPase involved in chromosome partitioning [Mycobacteroides abscessus subsp. bolletii]
MSTNFDSEEFPMDRLQEMRARLGALGRDLPNAVNNDFTPAPPVEDSMDSERQQPQGAVAADGPDVWDAYGDKELSSDAELDEEAETVDTAQQETLSHNESAQGHPGIPGYRGTDTVVVGESQSFGDVAGITDIDTFDPRPIWNANGNGSNFNGPVPVNTQDLGHQIASQTAAVPENNSTPMEPDASEVVDVEDVAPTYQVPPAHQFTAPVIETPVKPEYTYPNPLSQNINHSQAAPRTPQGFRDAAARNAANTQLTGNAGHGVQQQHFPPPPAAAAAGQYTSPQLHQQPPGAAAHPYIAPAQQGFSHAAPTQGGGPSVMPPIQTPYPQPQQYAPEQHLQQHRPNQNPAPHASNTAGVNDRRHETGPSIYAPQGRPQQGTQPALVRARKEAPKQSWRAIASSRFHLPVGKGADEITYDNQIDQINKGFYSPRKVAVLSIKGGVGKTTMTTALGSTYAQHYRDGAVAAVDAAEGGTLYMRVKERRPGNIKAFAADPNLTNDSAVGYYLATNSHRLRVLRSAPEDPRNPLQPHEYLRAVDVLSVGHRVIFVDMDPSMAHPCFQTILGSVDAMVLVTSTAADSIEKAKDLLAWMRLNNFGGLHDRTMVIINHQGSVKPNIDVAAEVLYFQKSEGRETLAMPWDDHLVEAGPVDLNLLNKGTRRQLVTAAAILANYLPTA